MYMIMMIQLVFNVVLFLCTTYQIRKLQQETKQMTKSGESRKFNRMEADKDRFANQLIKMFIYFLGQIIRYSSNSDTHNIMPSIIDPHPEKYILTPSQHVPVIL